MLVEAGLTSRAGLQAGLEEQQLRGGRLGYALMKIGHVTPYALHLFLQDNLSTLSPGLIQTMCVAPAVDLIPARLALHYGMVPIRVEDGVLDLAIANADSPQLIPALQTLTGLRVEPLVCPPSLIAEVLERSYPEEVEPGVILRPGGDSLFVLSDRRRGIRPLLPELVREDAPSSEWLRAILAEGIRRSARRVRIDPQPFGMRVSYHSPLGDEDGMELPRGAHPGLSGLIAGLASLASRGRVVPREGRMTLLAEGRRIALSVLALPGFEGDTCILDLREERVSPVSRGDVERDLADLPPALSRMADERRGLLLVAGPGPLEAVTGLSLLLDLLGDRLPLRAGVGDWPPLQGLQVEAGPADEEAVPLEARLARALALSPDLLVLPDSGWSGGPNPAPDLARDRPVILPVTAFDSFDAAERLARSGQDAARGPLVGIVGVRLMEQLCRACARPFDLHDLLSPWPRHRRPLPGSYFASQGCGSCRESGVLRLEPVFEFLPASTGSGFLRPGLTGRILREEQAREGQPTLFRAALRKASDGTVDIREPLRLLLHEPR